MRPPCARSFPLQAHTETAKGFRFHPTVTINQPTFVLLQATHVRLIALQVYRYRAGRREKDKQGKKKMAGFVFGGDTSFEGRSCTESGTWAVPRGRSRGAAWKGASCRQSCSLLAGPQGGSSQKRGHPGASGCPRAGSKRRRRGAQGSRRDSGCVGQRMWEGV